uniref:Uncharacterized protein n=1 Tax=Lepeophtheirus salmonis TaxID=72036 RepID=A0A0K2TQE7_LEPSM
MDVDHLQICINFISTIRIIIIVNFVVIKKFNNHKQYYSVSSVYMVRKGIAYTVIHVALTNLKGIFPFVMKYIEHGRRDSASLIYKVGFGISCSTYLVLP